MKDFEEIRRLWRVQSSEPVNIEDVFKRIDEQKNSYVNRLLLQTITIGIALLFIFTVWITATFHTWTSHLAMIIIIGSMIYYLRIQINDYRKINKTTVLFKKPDEYIAYLQSYKKSRFKLNTKTYQVYVIIISLSLCLFAIEMYYILPFWQLLIYIVLSIGWMLICQFVFMKQYNRREAQRLEEIIQALERLSNQFTQTL